jgi:hypothetical protein
MQLVGSTHKQRALQLIFERLILDLWWVVSDASRVLFEASGKVT